MVASPLCVQGPGRCDSLATASPSFSVFAGFGGDTESPGLLCAVLLHFHPAVI